MGLQRAGQGPGCEALWSGGGDGFWLAMRNHLEVNTLQQWPLGPLESCVNKGLVTGISTKGHTKNPVDEQ